MRLLLLFCLAMLEVTPETFITYKVLEVFPRGRRVAITCHSPQARPPITYSLWGSKGTEVAKKVVKTRDPASFSINITLKSRPDLLTYSCKAASPWGEHSASTKLQMYWELWTKPVSQLQATFTLLDRGSGPSVEISCRAPSGSPPITYSLVGKDGSVHMQQRPSYGQPADFSFALPNTSTWLQCQAENDLSIQSSPFKLVPPAAPGGHRGAGWQPHLHCRCHLLVAGPGLVDQVFALIVFSCIFGEGYSNTHQSRQKYCIFTHNEDACGYGIAVGVLAFLASAFFLVVDVYFPQISNVTDRKYLVISDLLFSALWTFLWFVGFCFLTSQWAATKKEDVLVGADSARAAITFSFFSIFSWGVLASLAYQRYKAGVDDFIQNYVDPTPDPSTAYASYPGASVDNYQQPPFTQNAETTEGYQPPPVY